MCDSRHAVDPESVKATAQYLTQQEIFIRFHEYAGAHQPAIRWVTYSGGNPCIHNLTALTIALRTQGYRIAVETQGTFAPSWLWKTNIVTASPKAPGMGEKFEHDVFRRFFDTIHVKEGFNIKIVVFSPADLEFAKQLIMDYPWIQANPDKFYLSQGNPWIQSTAPVAEMNAKLRIGFLELLALIQADPWLCQVKFLPQFHVWLWANQKGV